MKLVLAPHNIPPNQTASYFLGSLHRRTITHLIFLLSIHVQTLILYLPYKIIIDLNNYIVKEKEGNTLYK